MYKNLKKDFTNQNLHIKLITADINYSRPTFFKRLKDKQVLVDKLIKWKNKKTKGGNMLDIVLDLERAIREAEPSFLLQIIAVVRVLGQSSVLLDRLIDPVTIPKLFEVFIDALKWADVNIEIYILQILRLFFANNKGKPHVLKNQQMLSYASVSLAKENINIGNEAASLLIEIL